MKFKLLLLSNLLQTVAIVFILFKVGFIKFNFDKNWDNSFLYNTNYKDKFELHKEYLRINNYYNPIVFLGDSITEKIDWHELFHNSHYDILNRGIGSDTISGVINRINTIINLKPSKVFLMIGINDIALGGE